MTVEVIIEHPAAPVEPAEPFEPVERPIEPVERIGFVDDYLSFIQSDNRPIFQVRIIRIHPRKWIL